MYLVGNKQMLFCKYTNSLGSCLSNQSSCHLFKALKLTKLLKNMVNYTSSEFAGINYMYLIADGKTLEARWCYEESFSNINILDKGSF